MRVSKYFDEQAKTFEWTSISDTTTDGKPSQDYIRTEKKYLRAICEAIKETETTSFAILGAEIYIDSPPNRLISVINTGKAAGRDILRISRSCLREQIWCKLESHRLMIHFGHDYYLFFEGEIGSHSLRTKISSIGLNVNTHIRSPYLTAFDG